MNKERIYKLKVELFKTDLQEYFNNNLIDGIYKLNKFELTDGDIITLEPDLEEGYSGGNNKDIEQLCKKHSVDFKIVYWCYHK